MTWDQGVWLVGGGLLIALFAVIIPLAIADYKKNKDKYVWTCKQVEEQEARLLNAEPDVLTMHAEVIDMACGVNTVGHKQPKTVRYFLIKFKNDEGEILDVPVSERMYEGFEVGLSGKLTLVNGNLNSFEPDDC